MNGIFQYILDVLFTGISGSVIELIGKMQRSFIKSQRTVGARRIDLCRVISAWLRSRRYERAASAGYLAQFTDIWVKVTSSARLRRHFLARSALFRLCLRRSDHLQAKFGRHEWVFIYGFTSCPKRILSSQDTTNGMRLIRESRET